MRSDLIDIDVQVLHETAQAWLVTDGVPETSVWVPKSQCEISETGFGGIMRLTLPEWLAQEKELI
jgi:hypothetical protein